ncbi:hypothetical protein [Burkholderia thailandensis]|uniref:hypothetical protein n=1 Tax=Burkholderia thailandensis TaxID=57975 RepID=UPI0021B3FA5D|nr:hypothetical protein [Burkholderia thailandensis]
MSFSSWTRKAVLAISIGDFKEIALGVAEIDKDEQQALDKVKARRSKLNLDAIGIKSGDVLTFSRDESVTGIVVDGGKLLFDGEVMSLSAAALKALHAMAIRRRLQAGQATGCSTASCWRTSPQARSGKVR